MIVLSQFNSIKGTAVGQWDPHALRAYLDAKKAKEQEDADIARYGDIYEKFVAERNVELEGIRARRAAILIAALAPTMPKYSESSPTDAREKSQTCPERAS